MNADEFSQEMDQVERRMLTANLEEPIRTCLPVLTEGFEGNFLRAAGPDGVAWLPRKDTKPHPLLILSGALIEAARDTGNPGNIHEVSPDGRTLSAGVRGDVVPYADPQQNGRPERNLPARTYLYATEEVLVACGEQVQSTCRPVLFPTFE